MNAMSRATNNTPNLVNMKASTFTYNSHLPCKNQSTKETENTKSAVAPLLRLPPRLRHRVYLHTELLARYEDGNYAVLNLNGGTQVPSRFGYFPEEKFGFYGLLLSCRTIYAEASALLYRHNRFIIRYWEKLSLAPLRNLTPSSISNLTYLKIVLNQASCHHRGPKVWHEDSMDICDDERVRNIGDGNGDHRVFDPKSCNAPLEVNQQIAKALYAEWHSTVEYLSSYITPESLELSVICDVHHGDVEAAMHAVEPMGLLPALRNCHVRLSRKFTPQLYQIAQETVLQARRISKPPLPASLPCGTALAQPEKAPLSELQVESRLLALPRELRFRILEYTDLITPWKEVDWSRYPSNRAKYMALHPVCLNTEGLPCRPSMHHGCRFFNCWAATEQQQRSTVGCFCRVRHSAASSTCICWTPPSALFLVCHSLFNDAQVVFFSGNRFVVHDYRGDIPYKTPEYPAPIPRDVGEGRSATSKYHSDRLAASVFLREVVPPQMLREIHFLELVFPPYSHIGWPEEGHPALADWAETLRWAREKLNLRGLTLRLVMVDSPNGSSAPPGRGNITTDQVEEILSAYRRIISPLAVLAQSKAGDENGGDENELRKFHARIAWPWVWNFDYKAKIDEYGWTGLEDYLGERRRLLIEEAERSVMGYRYQELHDGGRGHQRTSVWEEKFYCGF